MATKKKATTKPADDDAELREIVQGLQAVHLEMAATHATIARLSQTVILFAVRAEQVRRRIVKGKR